MVENIWNTAKAFIGLSDEAGVEDYSKKEERTNLDLGPIRVRSSKKNNNSSDYEIMLYEPRAYEDSLQISSRLRSGDPVIVNLKYLDSSEGMRLIDFVCGTAFAIDGHMTKISETIFLLSPSSISISDNSSNAGQEEPASQDSLLHNRM
ncbi:MAG: cell division protein SepF [Candidatus Margulisiibacteriota bacterium]